MIDESLKCMLIEKLGKVYQLGFSAAANGYTGSIKIGSSLGLVSVLLRFDSVELIVSSVDGKEHINFLFHDVFYGCVVLE